MMRNAYVILKALFVLRYSNAFSPDFFCHTGKQLDKKAKINFKIYGVINKGTNNYNTHIAQYLKKKMHPDNEIWSVNRR